MYIAYRTIWKYSYIFSCNSSSQRRRSRINQEIFNNEKSFWRNTTHSQSCNLQAMPTGV